MTRQHHEIIDGRFILRALFRIDGIWRAKIRDLRSGKIREKSSGTRSSKGKAKEVIIAWLREVARQEDGGEIHAPFNEAWKEFVSLKEIRPSSRRDMEGALAVYCRHFGSDRFVHEIDFEGVERFLAALRDAGRTPRTRQKHLGFLREFFRWSRRRGYRHDDPTDGIKAPRPAARKGTALSDEEARALFAAATGYLKLAIAIALYTGLRRANVLGLEWWHVDLSKASISIPAAQIKSGKDHSVPIHPHLMELLTERRKRRKTSGSAPVLGTKIGSPKRAFRSTCLRAGISRPIRWHDLRHTFASWLESRVTFATLRRLMGHSPGSVTLQYVHVPWETLVEGIGRIPRLDGIDRTDKPVPQRDLDAITTSRPK